MILRLIQAHFLVLLNMNCPLSKLLGCAMHHFPPISQDSTLRSMSSSRIILATDHAGYPLKEVLKQYLQGEGVDTVDIGVFSEDPVDYPEIMRRGAAAVLEYGCPGIFLGGSGNGEAMAANKVRGIRAAVVWSEETAKLARAHNDANVMCLGGRLIKPELAKKCVDIFLSTEFEGGRHEKRVKDLE